MSKINTREPSDFLALCSSSLLARQNLNAQSFRMSARWTPIAGMCSAEGSIPLARFMPLEMHGFDFNQTLNITQRHFCVTQLSLCAISNVVISDSPLFSNSLPDLLPSHSQQQILPADLRENRSKRRISSIPATKFKTCPSSTPASFSSIGSHPVLHPQGLLS